MAVIDEEQILRNAANRGIVADKLMIFKTGVERVPDRISVCA
jgi:hypothetical protein